MVNKNQTNLCPHCGSIATVKSGKTAAGTQRYLCKDCRKTFTPETNTILSHSNLNSEQWEIIFKGIMNGSNLATIAKKIGMSIKCAWYNKHKIQNMLFAIYGEHSTNEDLGRLYSSLFGTQLQNSI